jgi:hypothetical protein
MDKETLASAAPGGQMRSPQFDLDHIFKYHSPTQDQLPKYEAIRAAAKVFAAVLLANTPASADQTAAMRHLRECVMTANASVALAVRT